MENATKTHVYFGVQQFEIHAYKGFFRKAIENVYYGKNYAWLSRIFLQNSFFGSIFHELFEVHLYHEAPSLAISGTPAASHCPRHPEITVWPVQL